MTDLELWQQLKAGERSALERIYREHVALLLQYGDKFSLSIPLVEDCVQDLFVDLWRRREHLSDTDSIRRYLMVALRRRIFQQLDRERKRSADPGPEGCDFHAEPAYDNQLVEAELAAEQKEQLREAFAGLSDRQREIIYLKYYAGLDYDTIGEMMDLNYQSARNLLSRALKKLKNFLEIMCLLIFLRVCLNFILRPQIVPFSAELWLFFGPYLRV